jgi:signal transduction histidine kinase/CheY-like chemotaxis protein
LDVSDNRIYGADERREEMAAALHRAVEIFSTRSETMFEDVMTNGLRPVADAADLDGIAVFRVICADNGEDTGFGQIYRWNRAKGGPLPVDEEWKVVLRNTAIERWLAALREDACISLRAGSFLEDEALILKPLGTKTCILVPIITFGMLWGVVAFLDTAIERDFDEASLAFLHSAARLCTGAIIREEEEKKAGEAFRALERSKEMTDGLNNLATLFLSYSIDSFEELMTAGAGLIVDVLDIDRLSVWRNHVKPDGLHSSQIFRWDRVSGGTTPPTLPDVRYADYAPNWETLFAEGGAANGPVRLMTAREAATLQSFGIVSAFVAPVFINGAFWGAALFEDRLNERTFDEDSAEMMRSAAFLFANTVMRAEMERSVARAEELTKLMLDATPLCCQLWDKNVKIIDCNKAAVELYGLRNKQEYMSRFSELLPEVQPDGQRSAEKAAMFVHKAFSEGYCRFEWMHRMPDGTPMPTEVTLVRVKYKDDYVVAGYTRDLREYKRMMEKIEDSFLVVQKASRAKSDFLSNMSHEMRTPMNAIIGMTKVAMHMKDTERKDYALRKIEEAAEHLLGIINDILDMSKIEAAKLELTAIAFDLQSTLQKIAAIMSFPIEEKRQNFSIHFSKDLPSLYIGDDQRLSQILVNLLSNAVKFTPEEGTISIDISLNEEKDGVCELCFVVSDSGIGISPEQQKKLFSAFEQADSGTTRKFGGTGLGLAISKRIIELMGGKILIDSDIGKGSRFVFTVKLLRAGPHARADGGDGAETNAEDRGGEFSGKRVLLAEDIEINREILTSLLDGTGLAIDIAENGREALEMIQKDPGLYDLVFMDIQMPEMDGYEATRRIRALPAERGGNLPIIAMTANVFKDDVENCLAAGMDGHIGKPLDVDIVLETLRRYLWKR